MHLPHSSDLRRGRVSEPGRIYHVRTSVAGRRQLFRDFQLGRMLVHCLRFVHERGDVESLAFVVMPDHLHWLFQLGPTRHIDGVMRSVKQYSALTINRRLGMEGTAMWQPGYFDRALRREEDLRSVARYIVANPVRAGLCRRVGDYPLWDAVWL
jgi:putative transposase